MRIENKLIFIIFISDFQHLSRKMYKGSNPIFEYWKVLMSHYYESFQKGLNNEIMAELSFRYWSSWADWIKWRSCDLNDDVIYYILFINYDSFNSGQMISFDQGYVQVKHKTGFSSVRWKLNFWLAESVGQWEHWSASESDLIGLLFA